MSHKVNDQVVDSILDTTDEWYEKEQEAQERMEDIYDSSYEPTCGQPVPTWIY
jgi:hypothetical protein